MDPTRRSLVLPAAGLATVAALLLLATGAWRPADPRHAGSPGTPASPSRTSDTSLPPPDIGSLTVTTSGWRTDFAVASVDLAEFSSGGPGKDGIPAIDEPRFESLDHARAWLDDNAPVIALEIDGNARAYPLAILIWHEIVNDSLGGVPVVVTFCPLCHTALVFERRLEGRTYDFGTTGNLRYSDLVMYDRQTESWWQQATGEALVGDLTGMRLPFLPSQTISLGDLAAAYPAADVLGRETGHARDYGRNPYPGYDRADERPFRFEGVVDGRIAPKERVVTVRIRDDAVAFPYTELAATGVAQDEIGGEPVAVLWSPGTASALDTQRLDAGRDVGATGVFRPISRGRTLTFEWSTGGGTRDLETGSRWSVTGLAVAGPLTGERLEPIPHGDHFWFAWAAFEPATRIWTASGADLPRPASERAGLAAALPPEVDGYPVSWIDVDLERVIAEDTRSVDMADLRMIVTRSGIDAARFRMVIAGARDEDGVPVFMTAFQVPGVAGSRIAGIVDDIAEGQGSDDGGLMWEVLTIGDVVVLVSSEDAGLLDAAVEAITSR